MNIVPIKDKKKIEAILHSGMTYRYGRIQSLIDEFIRSGEQIAEVTDLTNYKRAYYATNSINVSAKKMNVGVKAITRQGHVYIMKTV